MDVFESSYATLIDHLKILDMRMVLVNPKFNKPQSVISEPKPDFE